MTGFQSAPPRGGRLDRRSAPATCRRRSRFNPRPRAGGDAAGSPRARMWTCFRSAPPRGGRLLSVADCHARILVSIRAPARGATRAPHRDCGAEHRFNPRPRAGGDVPCASEPSGSISFQSAPPRGGRPSHGLDARSAVTVFQSAPPRGGRPPAVYFIVKQQEIRAFARVCSLEGVMAAFCSTLVSDSIMKSLLYDECEPTRGIVST